MTSIDFPRGFTIQTAVRAAKALGHTVTKTESADKRLQIAGSHDAGAVSEDLAAIGYLFC